MAPHIPPFGWCPRLPLFQLPQTGQNLHGRRRLHRDRTHRFHCNGPNDPSESPRRTQHRTSGIHHPGFLRLCITFLVPPIRFTPSLYPPNPPRLQSLQSRPRTLSPLFIGSNEQESFAQRQHDFINHGVALHRAVGQSLKFIKSK